MPLSVEYLECFRCYTDWFRIFLSDSGHAYVVDVGFYIAGEAKGQAYLMLCSKSTLISEQRLVWLPNMIIDYFPGPYCGRFSLREVKEYGESWSSVFTMH